MFKKQDGIYLGDNFVGISPRWLVPDGITAAGARETVMNAPKEVWLNWVPDTE